MRSLSFAERQELAEVIQGNRTSLTLPGLLPSFIRISTTKEVTMLLNGDGDRVDCVLALNRAGRGPSAQVGCGGVISPNIRHP
jgi:hypothetical protein